MSKERDKLIDKIKKLLALSENNTNIAEGISAALKAQKLIADNDIKDFELSEESETIEELMSDPYCGKRWREILAAIIAENFRCKNYILYQNKLGHRNGKIFQQVFVGYRSDATAALLVFNKLVKVGEESSKIECRKFKERYGTSQGVKNTFLLGFCYGVKLELEKQSQALMLLMPKAVSEYMESTLACTFDHNASSIGNFELGRPTLDCSAEGKIAGIEAVRASRLPETYNHLL